MCAADQKAIRERANLLKDEILDFMSVFVPMNDKEQSFYDSCLINLHSIKNLAKEQNWNDVLDGLEFLDEGVL